MTNRISQAYIAASQAADSMWEWGYVKLKVMKAWVDEKLRLKVKTKHVMANFGKVK